MVGRQPVPLSGIPFGTDSKECANGSYPLTQLSVSGTLCQGNDRERPQKPTAQCQLQRQLQDKVISDRWALETGSLGVDPRSAAGQLCDLGQVTEPL